MERVSIDRAGGARPCLAAAAVALALVALVAFPRSSDAAQVPYQRGVTVGEWGPGAYRPATMKKTYAKLRKLHVDTVTLFVVYMQKDGSSNSVAPGSETVSTRHLVRAIRLARAAGLRVILRPYVDRDDGGWRGQIHPTSPSAWFGSYAAFVNRFAKLAQRERVKGLVAGSELVTMSGDAARWRAIVAGLRQRFSGWVSYQANWDGEIKNVSWWDAVDAISISAYFPLSNAANPSVSELAGGWRSYRGSAGDQHDWYAEIDQLRQRFGKTVFFGEIGYRPVTGTAGQPWNTDSFGSFEPTAQANPYEAALQVWSKVPWFRGFEWWTVPPGKQPVNAGPTAGHEPLPAANAVLKRYYGSKR